MKCVGMKNKQFEQDIKLQHDLFKENCQKVFQRALMKLILREIQVHRSRQERQSGPTILF